MPDTSGADDYNTFVAGVDPDYEWVVPNVLEQGDRCIITGGEGKGKSTFERQLGLQVSLGVHPFTLEPMEPRRVLLVDLENSRRSVRREMKKMGSYILPAGQFTIACWPQGIDLLHPDSQILFRGQLDACKPELVIIGPMYKMTLLPLEREEHSRALSGFLDTLISSYKFSLIMESHQPHGTMVPDGAKARFYRPERPVGSSLWMRWPEFGLCLEDAGVLRPWRGARDAERQWPEKLTRGEEWPWIVDNNKCQRCGSELGPKQDKYCSEKCANAARQAKFRVTHSEPDRQAVLDMLDRLTDPRAGG